MTTTRDIIIYAGEAFTLSLPYAGTAGRGQRAHIRTADSAATVVQILTYNGATNARVLFDGTDALDLTIGGSVSAAWVVGANRVEWVYDIEDYDLSDVDDVVIPYRGKVIVYGNRTRESDVTPSDQMPSGDGRYVRFDTDAQGLSDAQKLAARTNIGAGTGGGGGSAAWGDITGTLSAQTDLAAALALKAPLASPTLTGVPAAPTASGGTNTTQIATTAFVTSAVASAVAGLLEFIGSVDASTNPNYSAASKGDSYLISVAGKIGGASGKSVEVGDLVVASADNAGGTEASVGSSWFVLEHNLAGALLTANALSELSGVASTARTNIGAQEALVSGTNIKTVNGTSLLGSGDIAISASPGGSTNQLQRNNAGAFDGMSGTAWDDTNRALTVTGATVTASAPVLDLSQTWNNGAVTFTGLKLNVTNTASAAASLLHDWQVGGTTRASISSAGVIAAVSSVRGPAGNATTPALSTTAATTTGFYFNSNEIHWSLLGVYRGTLGNQRLSLEGDTILARDAANVFAIRNTTNAQTFRVYGTYTDNSNYVRASLAATSTTVTLAAETSGTGADNVPVVITPAGTSQIEVGNGVQFTEMTAPSAPASNKVILYAQDNGAGKTQLMALFASGASQQVAIEP